MELCLYHHEFGYYAQEPKQVGRAGDFFTSVSCGPLFGILIAEKITSWWRESSITGPWRILEPGPNNGDLARDILRHVRQYHPSAAAHLTYVTIDPLDAPRAYQQQTLASFGAQVQCLANAEALPPLPTFVVANEVLDAFPCRIIERHDDEWRELWIDSPDPEAQLSEALRSFRGAIPEILRDGNYPIGYRTELRDPPTAFFASLQRCMTQGRLLFFDYGFAEPEFYDLHRTQGTLRVYRNHQASETPLLDPGMCDLTAHVDFTAVFDCMHDLGMRVRSFDPQEFFLCRLMMPMVQQGHWQQAWQHNLQTLTHPTHLGGKFHALELSYNEEATDDPLALKRLARAE